MRIRTRTYSVAFGIAAATTIIHQQHPILEAEAFRSSTSPLISAPRTASIALLKSEFRQRRCNPNIANNNNNHYDSSCSSSRTDADTEIDEDTKTRIIKRKSYGAPVVDSTLLRFISQQKNIPNVFASEAEAMASIPASAMPASSPPRPDVSGFQQTTLLSDEVVYSNGRITRKNSDDGTIENEKYVSTTNAIKEQLAGKSVTVKDTNDDFVLANTLANADVTSTSNDSWMAQFGSANVAQLLQEMGGVSDIQAAKAAGEAVERYCVVRTARRRIRLFLKERDSMWASSVSSDRSELESLAASDMATSPAAALLLSYAAQQRKSLSTEEDGSTDDESDVNDWEISTPSYGFEDILKVMKNYGLTGNDLSVLLTHSPNLALRVPSKKFLRSGQSEAETLEETLERSLRGLLMETLGLRRYDARKVLRNCPGLLSVRGSKSAVQVVTIMTKLGVSAKSLARDKNALPVLLSRSPAGLFRLVAFLSSTAIQMPLEQIGPLLRRRVGRELMDFLLPVPATSYSKNSIQQQQKQLVDENEPQLALEVTTSEEETSSAEDAAAAWRLTRKQRQDRIERTYAVMYTTARILKAQIGSDDLSKVVASYPSVLLLDAEKQILPVARYLMGGLGIWQNDLSSVLNMYPTLLGTKIEELERRVSYVLAMGVDEDDLAGIFRAFPGLFDLPVGEMEKVVSYLESIGVQDIGAFVTKLPPVLGYSVEEELAPKWEYLKTVTLQPEYEIKAFPAYFSYPFDRVIKTRFNYLAYKGISIRFASVSIDTVLRFGDADFATMVAMDDDDGEAFRAFAAGPHQAMKKKKRSASFAKTNDATNKSSNYNYHANQNRRREAKAALAAALQLSEEIDNAKSLSELNNIIRKAEPLRNRSLSDSLPSLGPSRPKRRRNRNKRNNQQRQRTQQQGNANRNNRRRNNNNANNGGEEGTFPLPA